MITFTKKLKCCLNWFKAPDFSFKMDNDDIENNLHLNFFAGRKSTGTDKKISDLDRRRN